MATDRRNSITPDDLDSITRSALLKSESILNASQLLAKVGGWEWDIVHQTMFWTDEVYRIHDIDRADISPGSPDHIQKSLECYSPEDRQVIVNALERCAVHGEAYDLDLPFTTAKGRKRFIRTTAQPVTDNGVIVKVVGNIMDISERKQTEDKLREINELFKQFMNHSPIYTFICEATSDESCVLQASENYRQMIGIPGSEMVGKTMTELFPADLAAKIIADNWSIVTSGQVLELQENLNNRSYTTIKFPIVHQNKSVLAGYTIDITEQKLANIALNESEERFRSLMEDIPNVAVQGYALDGTVLFWNLASELLYGYSQEEALGANLLNLIIPEEMKEGVADAIRQMSETGRPIPASELLLQRKDGSRVPVFSSHALVNPIGRQPELFCLDIDLTELKQAEAERIRLEQQLLHAQKMESLGVLAGGIAHDFNNILTAIVGNTELALMKLTPESPAIEHLKRIEKSAVRATDLAKQMLAYSGKGRFIIETIDLNRLIEEMGQMLDVSISKKAVLRYNLTRPLPSVEVDATQIRQVVMNLAINASEAIGEKSGVMAISTGCIDCNRDYLKNIWLNCDLPEGFYVYLEVSDTGCGMDKDTQARLFDPFFTTKFTGRGLGMAAVQGIVKGHKGAITVSSEPGEGSSFKILLPAGTKPAELSNEEVGDSALKGEGTVLLVDDEETVRAIGSEMLRTLGFKVITANDGKEAIDLYKANPGLFCVIMDLTMPHMDGDQAFRELKVLDPAVKVIMSSGYSEYEVTQKFVGKGLAGFIQKPYRLSVVSEMLTKLDSNPA